MISIRLEEFIDTKSIDKLVELYELLSEEKLSAKDTGVNYRMLNHWDEKGIIRFSREKKESNRKFSFVDFIWIKVVNELRSFGIQLPVIKKIADDVYESLPLLELFENFVNNVDILKNYQGKEKEEFLNFFKSGDYKKAEYDLLPFKFNYLQVLMTEAIATRKSVTLIVFSDGEWFPFIKENEHHYPRELLYKKEFHSQVRVNITDLIFKFIIEDYLIEYLDGLHLFTGKERKLLSYIKEGDYKKVIVFFKSKKQEPLEIIKSKPAQEAIIRILREKDYREFILIDKKNNELRITDKEVEPRKLVEKKILVKNDDPNSKRKFKVITITE